MTTITLLHTSPAHLVPFQTLADRIAPDVDLVQEVHEDWLDQVRQTGMKPELADEISNTVRAAKGTVICTCTSVASVAAAAGAIRIDEPMMENAARIGGPILVVFTLESSRKPSMGLLSTALLAVGNETEVVPLFLGEHWPLFEAGDQKAFIEKIANSVRDEAEKRGYGCIALAQASMAPAAALLEDLGVPVLTSPESALRAALAES